METMKMYQIVGPASCGVLAESNSLDEIKNELLEMRKMDEEDYEVDAITGLLIDDDEEAPYTITQWDGKEYQTVCTLRINNIRKNMDLASLMGGK